MKIKLQVGEKNRVITREQARDLFYDLERLMEEGALDDPPEPEIHTVKTEIDFLRDKAMEQMASQMGALIYKNVMQNHPYAELVA